MKPNAEFLHNNEPKTPIGGMNSMGKPISFSRRAAADSHCKEMGMKDADKRIAVVNGMSEYLERDKPYEAIQEGMRYLDLTGTYRLMAVLLSPTASEVA